MCSCNTSLLFDALFLVVLVLLVSCMFVPMLATSTRNEMQFESCALFAVKF